MIFIWLGGSSRPGRFYVTWKDARLVGVVLGACATLGFLALAVGFWIGQRGGEREPEQLLLRDFIARRPLGNRHVLLRDLRFCERHAYQTSQQRGVDRVFLPIVPGDQPGQPRRIHVIVQLNSARNEGEIDQFMRRASVQGTVSEGTVPQSIVNILRVDYPETDFRTCLVIDEGQSPLPAFLWIVMVVAALASAIFTISLFVYHRMLARTVPSVLPVCRAERVRRFDDDLPERDRHWR